MGGNALKKTYTERKGTNDFLRIGNAIKEKLFHGLNLDSTILQCYHTKETHGDLDLLIKMPSNSNIDFNSFIKLAFNPNEIFINGGVYSFDYESFQIDFIPINEISWDVAQTYGSYDPLGNIMGKSFHKFNLSYGWEGLRYKFRNFNGNNSHDIHVTNDIRKIFEFGGYDYDRYLKGFDNLVDIYEFCISGKYFNHNTFKMENLTQIDRKRNRKRKSYNTFLEYVNSKVNLKSYEFKKNKDEYLPMIDEYFPEAKLIEKLEFLKAEDILNQQASEKFNGTIIMEMLPELEGKELGLAIRNFKESINGSYRDFILNTNIDDIKSQFIQNYRYNE